MLLIDVSKIYFCNKIPDRINLCAERALNGYFEFIFFNGKLYEVSSFFNPERGKNGLMDIKIDEVTDYVSFDWRQLKQYQKEHITKINISDIYFVINDKIPMSEFTKSAKQNGQHFIAYNNNIYVIYPDGNFEKMEKGSYIFNTDELNKYVN